MAKDNLVKIGGELKSVAPDGIVADALAVKDYTQNKTQGTINGEVQTALDDRYTKEQTYTKEETNALITTPDVEYVTVSTYSALPAEGAADTIYRVSCWDGSQVDATKYTLYAWNGSGYTELAVRSSVGEVFDISEYHASGGTLATYADLAAALGTGGANVPEGLRKGGMSVKFVQTSDNKYVQYRLMSQTFSTIESDWQGVDDEPTADSSNTVKSGGVFNSLYAYQPINLPSERTNIINGNQWVEKTQQLQGIILKITPSKSYKFYNDSSANIHYSTEIAILQTNDVTVGTTPSYSSSYPSPITVNGKTGFEFKAPQDGNYLYAKIKDAYGNRTLEFGEYLKKFDLKEDMANKKQSIDSPNEVDYPSTLAMSDFVNKVIRETVRQLDYTASTLLDETLFNASEGDKVVVTISDSFTYGIKFKLYSGDTVVQQKIYYAAVENAEVEILGNGVLKVEAANTNTHNASIKVELINYGTVINKVVSYVGNYQQDDNVFNLTNPSVKGFLNTNDYDNNDYTYTYVNNYNSKSFFRKDWPLPVILRWEPVNSTDTYILLSDSTPVTPVTWESNEYPKSDFWFNVPSGVFSYKIYNLIPNKTYYYVIYGIVDEKLSLLKQGSFTTEGKVRMLNVDNLQNVRDLGGWNANGGTVAYDMIFRGTAMDERAALAKLTSGGMFEMNFRLAIRTDIDLRGDYSRYIDYDGTIKAGSPLGVETEYYPKAISSYDAGLQGQSATNIGEIIEEINTRLSNNRKVYIHCSGGCDRSETLCYLILGLLGVSESDLAKEYELSSFANADGYALGKYRTRNSTVYRFPQFVSAIKQYNGTTLSDKIETFLLANGVSSTIISSLRALLVVP